jgi:hypothetical protein
MVVACGTMVAITEAIAAIAMAVSVAIAVVQAAMQGGGPILVAPT